MENVKITPQLVDVNGTPGLQEGEITADDTFQVEFLFEDLLTDNDVVQAGYTDVLFNPNFVLLQENGISYGEGYTIQRSGDNRLSNNEEQIGRLSEVGAAAGSIDATANQEEPQLVFTLTFIAQADLSTNPVTIESEKPDQPTTPITLFGNDDEQTDNTEYGELTIGPDVNIIESDGSTDVSEDGDTDTYELVLNSEPSDNVTIEVNNVGQVTLQPTSLTFTPGNWDTPQEVTVTAVDEDVPDPFQPGQDAFNITHEITEGSATEYVTEVDIDNVVAQVSDNDVENQPPEFDEATFTFDLDPNQADQFSETIAASDPNDDDLTYSITEGNDPDGNDTDAFTIDNDGVITVAEAAELDGQTVFNLTVEASDETSESTANVEINVGAGPSATLDIGGNGGLDQPDALLLLGFAFGDDGLIGSVIEDANANSFTPNVDRNVEEVKTFIENNETLVDIGGNDGVDQPDALLLLGFAFGDDGLIGSVIEDANANSFTPNVDRNVEEVKTFIETNSP